MFLQVEYERHSEKFLLKDRSPQNQKHMRNLYSWYLQSWVNHTKTISMDKQQYKPEEKYVCLMLGWTVPLNGLQDPFMFVQ